MRINKIKLSGFKSFVDPTVLELPNNLTAVVGPNGCGKSNVVDAFMWVMGESSAKHLRGESMQDVIFNGSSARKPIGQASIELLFDNSDGKITGPYAGYNEISIKRQVTRDGISTYYLNGSRCRRRDITGIFLGTGLGPRSYSVIEQGMISRVIEARPEELRGFLEEAAGISKYKERRRETENRIRHTNENLERLSDIREELDKQLTHLRRQARAAERYQVLKQEERQTKAELLVIRARSLEQQVQQEQRACQRAETDLEAAVAVVRAVERDIEAARQSHSQVSDDHARAQARFYSVGAEIARLEQAIRHNVERRDTLTQDIHDVETECAELAEQSAHEQQRLATLDHAIGNDSPSQTRARIHEQDSHAQLQQSEQSLEEWRSSWEAAQAESAKLQRLIQVEETRIEHIQERLQDYQQRQANLQEEKQRIDVSVLAAGVTQLQGILHESEEARSEAEVRFLAAQRDSQMLRHREDQLRTDIDARNEEYQAKRGRLASLEALQQSALGRDRETQQAWLSAHGLADLPRLAEKIRVAAGWEHAAEAVLMPWLESLCLDHDTNLVEIAEDWPEGHLHAVWDDEPTSAAKQSTASRLSSKVEAPEALHRLLNSVHLAANRAEATAVLARLSSGDSVITPEGLWLGKGWLQVRAQSTASILDRERDIEALRVDIAQLEAVLNDKNQQLQNNRRQLEDLEQEQQEKQQNLHATQQRLAEYQSQLAAKRTSMEQYQARSLQISDELHALEDEQGLDSEDLEAARDRLAQARRDLSSIEDDLEQLTTHREQLVASLQEAREASRRASDQRHQLDLRLEAMRTEQVALERASERSHTRMAQLRHRQEQLQTQLAALAEPARQLNVERDAALQQQLDAESALKKVRDELQKIDEQLREFDKKRSESEQMVQARRDEVERRRVAEQTVKVRLDDLLGQVTESGFERRQLDDELDSAADTDSWTERLANVERKITRLGPINLAAIDESQQLEERKSYLDDQHADLSAALETLETAIRKIDRETRTRFKETYDRLNVTFQDLFPKLFGGGHAYLELSDDNLLEAGVTVMARPPGKRNSTIHLLSGGEKALTAVALVFALFELNPAPFCMLDEVDAPLDDTNVQRLCDLIKRRAEQIQFVVITHNKITMEIAKELIGVTMQEPGVSRLVSVNIDTAVQMSGQTEARQAS
jgi:chromosome segregation protein